MSLFFSHICVSSKCILPLTHMHTVEAAESFPQGWQRVPLKSLYIEKSNEIHSLIHLLMKY